MTNVQPYEINSENIPEEGICFFKELYNIMKKYNVHRIYTASLDKKKLIVAQQLVSTSIANTKLTINLFDWLDKHIPWLYFNIIFRNHIFRYKLQLKKLFKKYGIEKIGSTSFNLYQGINITNNGLTIRAIDLSFKEGHIYFIENLQLGI